MDNIKKKILTLVSLKPSILDNQNELVATYWAVFDRAVEWTDVQHATKAETIIREFRNLSNAGMLAAPRPRKEGKAKEMVFEHEFKALV